MGEKVWEPQYEEEEVVGEGIAPDFEGEGKVATCSGVWEVSREEVGEVSSSAMKGEEPASPWAWEACQEEEVAEVISWAW